MKLLFFKAPWCGACHAIENSVPSYAQHIDCEQDEESAIKHNICSLPVFIAIDDEDNEAGRVESTNVKMVDYWFKKLAGVDCSKVFGEEIQA